MLQVMIRVKNAIRKNVSDIKKIWKKPYFTDADLTAVSFETYSDLDSLGRCGVAYASVGKDLMLLRATVARRR